MQTKIYKVSNMWAREKNIPSLFAATQLRETPKAMYLYGHGTAETRKTGRCCMCGRELTHSVSVELGIGPECGNHWWDWDLIGGYSQENLDKLKGKLQELIVDTWLPKSVVEELDKSNEQIIIPNNHPQLEQKQDEMKTILKIARLKEKTIIIKFPFSWDTVDQVKQLDGRKFNSKEKYWTCPLSVDNVENLKKFGFKIDEQLETFLQTAKTNINHLEGVEVPSLKKQLYPFQKQGLAFAEEKDGRALIGDEMGLGKTIQALAYLELHPEKRPVIIVCPASLKWNWRNEIHSTMSGHQEVEVLEGKLPYSPQGEILIINYDILPDWVVYLKSITAKVLITDECHYYKNNKAKRTRAVMRLGKEIPHVLALSGTPIVNRPIEVFNAIKLVNPTIFPDRWQYAKKYCGLTHNGFGWDMNGATNKDELHEKLSQTIMIRRKKKDVLKDLPDKVRSFVPMEINNQDEYKRAVSDFIGYLKTSKGNTAASKAQNAEVLTKIEVLKQLSVKGKMKQAISWIQDFLETGEKLVIFCTHRSTIDLLMKEFPMISIKVDGSVTGEERQNAVAKFQNEESIKLFVGNIKAAGVGITLTAASNVMMLELPWTPGELTQAEDRCHRIGQEDSVTIYYPLAQDTIEEKIARMLDHKTKVLDAVLDGKETDEESLLSELIESYKS